ncbi:hypothetical protein NDN08_003453 [Rhodosorus marinus]|uniref:CAP-Gly domain-containing protein n=1 Tax=Rhodosorus marinus TaxID=101924 RepID=A0AAV8UX83_9RHOD|nr:hypothetical protein NDN08_003453 [Rhodosorus marinus]
MDIKLDDRIESVDGFRGWVRYVGEVAGRREQKWYGIEWDEEERGKHDGVYDGYRYFQCRREGSFGSFVKPKMISGRQTLGEAVMEKYSPKKESLADSLVVSKPVELDLLTLCSVSGMKVAAIRPGDESIIPSVTDLDLSNNLLSSWGDLATKLAAFEQLSSLTLSKNFLLIEQRPPVATILPSLKTLIISSASLESEDADALMQSCPRLESCVLHGNRISDVTKLAKSVPKSLRVLDLSDNEIDSWETVSTLKATNLENLNFSGNRLRSISTHLCEEGDWQSLSTLSLSRNPLETWESVEALAFLPSLVSLRISGTGIGSSINDDFLRQGVIGRLEKLTILNGSDITVDDRLEAEKAYLGEVLRSEKSRSNPGLSSDGRIGRLRKKYSMFSAESLPSSEVKAVSKIADQLIQVNMRLIDGPTVTKRLPGSTDLKRLRLVCQKIFRIKKIESLAYLVGDLGDPASTRTYLTDASATLSSLSVAPEGVLVIEAEPAT